MYRRGSVLLITLGSFVLLQLVGCKPIQTLSKNDGVYLTNSAYYGWCVGDIWFNSVEHLYSVSDSLVVHSLISKKGIVEKKYKISKVEHRGKHKSVYFASNINAAFVFDRRNRSIQVFNYKTKLYALKPIPSEIHFRLILVEKYESPKDERSDHLISRHD